MAFRIGVSQAAKATADIPNPIIFKKSLREWPGSCSTPRSTNSLSACFTYPGSFFSSSMPFQYIFLLLIEPLSVIRYPLSSIRCSAMVSRSIVTFPAFQSSDVLYLHGRLAVRLVKLQQLVIVGVAFGIHVGFPVAIDAPAHRQQGVLLHDIHFLDGAVARLAFYAPYVDVLGMIEIGQVGHVVVPHPLNRFLLTGVGSCYRIIPYGSIDLSDLRLAFLDLRMAIHADVGRRNVGLLAFHRAGMAILTINFVLTGMQLV